MASALVGVLGSSSVSEAAPTLTKESQVFGTETQECTPILYRGQHILFQSHKLWKPWEPSTSYLLLKDVTTGQELAKFGAGYSFGNAYVNGDQINVYAAKISTLDAIYCFTSTDKGKSWTGPTRAVPGADGEWMLNSSVTKDRVGLGYLMAYESNKPVGFCFKFARSKDLAKWEKVSGLVFAGVEGKEYSACPVIRYFAPYYYAIYLHAAIPGHNGWVSFLARSKDLATWQLSPKNPILEAGQGEGSNNSDVDLIEINGKTYVYYLTGDQQTWGDLKRAMYPEPMQEFFESYFPQGSKPLEISARAK